MNRTRIYKRSNHWIAVTRHEDGTTSTKRFRTGHGALINLDRRNMTDEDFRKVVAFVREAAHEVGRVYSEAFRRVGAALAAPQSRSDFVRRA